MKQTISSLFIASMLASANALETDNKAIDWNNASSVDKSDWLRAVVGVVNPSSSYKFTQSEVGACLDSFLKKPVPLPIASMSLKDATAGCLSMIENR